MIFLEDSLSNIKNMKDAPRLVMNDFLRIKKENCFTIIQKFVDLILLPINERIIRRYVDRI